MLREPVKGMVDMYMELYPGLAELFAPLDVDLVFLNSASLPVRFEAVSRGRLVYCSDVGIW